MKLWRLYPVDPECRRWGYDCNWGFIVRAETEAEARASASANASDEGEDAWSLSEVSHCDELTLEGPTTVVMADFHAG